MFPVTESGSAGTARALRSVIDGAGIQSEQLIIASTIQRKILHLTFTDQAGGVIGGCSKYVGFRGNLDGLAHVANLQSQLELLPLADDEHDSGLSTGAKSGLVGGDFVVADGQ